MKKTILLWTGQPNSGKSSVSEHLAERYGFSIIRPSDLIRAHAREYDIPLRERRDYIQAHLGMIALHGDNYVTDTVLHSPHSRVTVDGERIPWQAQTMRQHGAFIVALDCPAEIRHARALARGADRDKLTFEAFLEDERREYYSTEPPYTSTLGVSQMADYRIDASKPLEEVLDAVDRFVAPLLSA